MITLKEALKLPKDELANLRSELAQKITQNRKIGAYVEQHTGEPLNERAGGVPILIKDNIQVKGWQVTSASKILQGYYAPYDATVIVNLQNAGLAPFGRANMDEFAMGSSTETSFYGRTLNPHNHDCVPGGSSGGSAAAVAGGFAIAALGSDTGGSIRQPAAFCGCVGLKPTYGRVSRYGLAAYSSSLDQIGPLAQNVEDAAILYDAIAGFDPKDSTSVDLPFAPSAAILNPKRKLKIAVIENYLDQCNPDVAGALQNAVKTLEVAGHTIVPTKMGDCAHHVATYYVLATAEASANYSRYDGVRYGFRGRGETLQEIYEHTRSEGFGKEVKRRLLLGAFVLSSGYYDAYYRKAQKVRQLISNEFARIHEHSDLILTPVTPTVAFEFGSRKSPLDMYLSDIFTISVNLAGLPAISLPAGSGAGGLPVGVQLIGKAFDEQSVLDGALSLETALK
ncbi:glutamyl-tRNA(Gln) amidotransferase subunit A [Campylobacterota bacterium]|nr:glutamyl-tRNA(Gln) amidotransferase subunit A [Campylobacterota bacterium]